MSDELLLYLLIVGIYLAETIVWLPAGTLLIRPQAGKGWLFSGDAPGNLKGGLGWMHPFPWRQTGALLHGLPVAISPRGMVNRPVENGDRLPPAMEVLQEVTWASHPSVRLREGTVLVVDGEAFCRCHTVAQADALARLLESLADPKRDQAERERCLDRFMERRFARAAVAKTRKRLLLATRFLRGWNSAALFLVAGLFPAIYLRWPYGITLFAALLAALGMGMVSAWSAFALHRRLYPEEKNARLKNLLKHLFCFPTAFAAQGDFFLRAHPLHEPLVVAREMLPKTAWQKLAARVWLDLAHPLHRSEPESPLLPPARQRQRREIRQLLARDRIDPAALDHPVPPALEGIDCYCPRCGTGYLRQQESCPECPGVAMLPAAGASPPLPVS
ncbi:MAG TPA: hypothetical protein VNQ90_06980 [Chthoniobacteraceae bacterium]|nr:hypothetical protein [Chthoniobacteraceae bacterium]